MYKGKITLSFSIRGIAIDHDKIELIFVSLPCRMLNVAYSFHPDALRRRSGTRGSTLSGGFATKHRLFLANSRRFWKPSRLAQHFGH